jgi:hypothetical protein
MPKVETRRDRLQSRSPTADGVAMNARTEAPRPKLEKHKPERVSHFATPVDDDTMEFIQAIEAYKKAKRRPFPTWSEALQVLKELGYKKPR